MQSPYNGVFLKSEIAALLCNHVLQLTLDVYKPVFLRCNKDIDIMIACMEAVPSQFSEEVYEKYTRQVCSRNRDFKSLVCSVIRQMAAERHEKDGYTVVVEGTEDVIGKVFVKRFLIAMAASDSVRSGRFFDPNHTVECTLVTQSNARDCLWGIADEFIRIEKVREDESEVSSVAPSRSRKKKHKRKHRREHSDVSDNSYESECTAVSIQNHDNHAAPTDVDAWGEVDDDVNPMDSVSQVFAATDNRSHTSARSEVKMSPPIYNQPQPPPVYAPPPVQSYGAPTAPPPPPPPPPPPQQYYR